MADDVHGSLSTETVSVMARDDKSHSDKDLMSAVHEKTLQELEFVTETDGGKLMEYDTCLLPYKVYFMLSFLLLQNSRY
jgi:hypothetical protein